MALQAQIQLPGLISVAYPYQGQTITSHVRLSGNVIIPEASKLPAGTSFITSQLSPSQAALVLSSHQLFGKPYIISRITYYMDEQAVREVDYTADEIRTYAFSEDYVGVIYGDKITPGPHRFSIMVTAISAKNPGVTLFDVLDLDFNFDDSSTSVRSYLDKVAPQQFVGQIDHQMVMEMLDYIMTQRTEGAIKSDIDALETLYDIDAVPQQLIPYLAKTVGYEYFAGLLGNDSTIREELRFLPDWQKSAGTAESILVLLRALSLRGQIIPLYLDLVNNVLTTGVKQRYEAHDEIKVEALTKKARFTFPLVHPTFVPSTVLVQITVPDGTVVAKFAWDLVLDQVAWLYFDNGSGEQWLQRQNGTHADLPDVAEVFADQERGGVTIVFTGPVKVLQNLVVAVDYQYEFETRPRKGTKLSEFFDMVITSLAKPNDFSAKDYNHVFDIVKRSKPLRTKLRSIEFPASSADAYVVNADTVSSTGEMSNADRLIEFNIDRTAANLNHPMSEQVSLRQFNRLADGFLFTWDNCQEWENRFGLFYSLAIEPSYHGEAVRHILATDGLAQRGHALIVNDDRTYANNLRYLRRVGFRMDNFTTPPPCVVAPQHLTHFYTLQHQTSSSPAITSYRDMVIDLDGAFDLSPAGGVELFYELMSSPTTRQGFSVRWDGGSTFDLVDLNTNVATTQSWDVDGLDQKLKTWSFSFGDVALTLVRFRTQADVDALWNSRPNLRNVVFDVGGSPNAGRWYAIWDITADFFSDPVHLSVLFSQILIKTNGMCCCVALGAFTPGTPTLSQILSYADYNSADFNFIEFNGLLLSASLMISGSLSIDVLLGKAYQFDQVFDIEIINIFTNKVDAIFRWNGSYWFAFLSNSNISATLDPAFTSPWTNDLRIKGTISYSGVSLSGATYIWAARTCVRRASDNMQLSISQTMTDDFSAARAHRGTFAPQNDALTYLDVFTTAALFEHRHNQGDIREVAEDRVYLKSGNLFPGLRYTVTRPISSLTYDSGQAYDDEFHYEDQQMQFDVDNWDEFQFDTVTNAQFPCQRVLHFPDRIVWEDFAGPVSLATVPFYVGT